jgi:HSP20 family molecular chaperone IbpA
MKSVALLSLLCLLALGAPAGAQSPAALGQRQGFSDYASADQRFSWQRGVRFERYRDQEGYRLRIHTRGIDPEAIQVSVQGRSLLVQNREAHQIERRSDRGGYQFATTSSSMRRRFPLPPDADAGAMTRTLEDGAVVITLPYARTVRF